MRVKHTGLNLKDPMNDTVLLNKVKFKVSSVIFHEGGDGTIDGKHCINLLRYNGSWVKTSDSEIKMTESWSKYGPQPYFIFLENEIEKKDTITEKYSPSVNLDQVQKRKNEAFLLSPFQTDSKKARIDERANKLNRKTNRHSYVKTCRDQLLS